MQFYRKTGTTCCRKIKKGIMYRARFSQRRGGERARDKESSAFLFQTLFSFGTKKTKPRHRVATVCRKVHAAEHTGTHQKNEIGVVLSLSC